MEEAIRLAMFPTPDEIRAAPLKSNAAVAAELLGNSPGRALDVGCGNGKFTRVLARICGDVTGIDVKERRIEDARKAAPEAAGKIDYRVASGEDLPFPDSHFDVVVFSNSLHHIPNPGLALREALRVLVPDGLIYIMEPVPSGSYQEAIRPVNDETIIRTEAYRAALALAGKSAASVTETMFRAHRRFADFEEWKADQIDVDEKRREIFEANPDFVRRNFETHAVHENGGLAFDQVFRVNLLKKLQA